MPIMFPSFPENRKSSTPDIKFYFIKVTYKIFPNMVHYHIRQKIYICVSGFSSEKPGMVGRHYHFIFSKIFHIDIAFFFSQYLSPSKVNNRSFK